MNFAKINELRSGLCDGTFIITSNNKFFNCERNWQRCEDCTFREQYLNSDGSHCVANISKIVEEIIEVKKTNPELFI